MAAFGLHVLVENPISELANYVLVQLKNKRAQRKKSVQVYENCEDNRETKVPVNEHKEDNLKGEISRLW